MFEIYSFFEKRCEITLFISFYQIFEQEFTKTSDFLSICQLRLSIFRRFVITMPHYLYIGAAKLQNNLRITMETSPFFVIFAIVMKQKEHHVIISLASNENQEAVLAAAREQLTQLLTEVHFTSAIWTEPIGTLRKEPYLNQLCEGTTTFGDGLLGEVLKETERRLGRTHNEEGIVALDLDLLAYDDKRFHLRDWDRSYVKDLISEL